SSPHLNPRRTGSGNEKPPGPDGHVGVARWLPLGSARAPTKYENSVLHRIRRFRTAGWTVKHGGRPSQDSDAGWAEVLESAGDGAGGCRADESRVFRECTGGVTRNRRRPDRPAAVELDAIDQQVQAARAHIQRDPVAIPDERDGSAFDRFWRDVTD